MSTTGVSNAELSRKQLEVGYNQRELEGILGYYIEDPLFVDHTQKLTLTSIDEIREYVLAQWGPASRDEVTIEELIRQTNHNPDDKQLLDIAQKVLATFRTRAANNASE
jgi:hypothetical protein